MRIASKPSFRVFKALLSIIALLATNCFPSAFQNSELGLLFPAKLILATLACPQELAPQLCEPWETEYSGEEAAGKYVIGLWQFSPGAELKDSSPNSHHLELKGATISPNGRFGPCLESHRGWPDKDEPHAAVAPNKPDLTPKGAFTLELWLKPKPELEGYPESFRIDNTRPFG